MPPYGAVQAYPPMLTETYSEYLSSAPVSVSLPLMMHFSDAIKQDTGYPSGEPVDEGLLLYTGYSGCPLPGVDLSTRQPSPCDQIPHVSASSLHSTAPIEPVANGFVWHRQSFYRSHMTTHPPGRTWGAATPTRPRPCRCMVCLAFSSA